MQSLAKDTPLDASSAKRTGTATPSTGLLLAAFMAVYVVWGSTYLAIRFAVETIPPFIMGGTRFLTAGLFLYAISRFQRASSPTREQWRDATITGFLMLAIGNGGVTWAEVFVPSGVAALMIALTPLWMVLFDWLRPQGVRPRWRVFAGLAVGFVGVAILARGETTGITKAWGLIALVTASMSWAFGSLFSRRARKPDSAFLAVAMQLIAGGSLMLALGLACGEASTFSFARINARSAASWLYLSLAGSVVGFTAYIWLLQVSTPARVGTYAFVNPLIAVLLGWAVGHETVSRDLLVAAGLIVVAVAFIVRSDSLHAAGQGKIISKKLCR